MAANTGNTILVQPDNVNATLWKYMDLPEFLYLLQEKRLWFTRMDLLGDPFEGSIETRVLDNVPLAGTPDMPASAKPTIERLQRQVLRNFIRTQKMSSFISCWTEEERELMALWRSYKRSDYSVAIRATYSTLRDQLPGYVLLGKVFYTDFLQPIDQEMIKNNLLYYAIRKQEGFKFEKEVRAVIYSGMKNLQTIMDATNKKVKPFQQITEIPFPDQSELSTLEVGEAVQVDVNALILEIRTNPICPRWFLPVFEKLCRDYGFKNPVTASTLDASAWNLVG